MATEYEKERNKRLREEAMADKQRNIEMRKQEEANSGRGSTYSYDMNSGQSSPVMEGGYSGTAAAKRKKYIDSQTE